MEKKDALTVRESQAVALPAPSFPELVTMGEQLVRTGFLPEHIRTGAQFAAIVMTGAELGMTTMRAVRSLALVKGKVAEYADSQLARFKASGGRARFLHLDEHRAVLELRHPNGDEHTETWTEEDGKRAGLGGGMHSKYPKAMNRSRAITAGLKSIGWDGAVGTYDPGELAEPDTITQQTPAPSVPEVLPPAPRQGIDKRGVIMLRDMVAAAEDADALEDARERIGVVVTGESERAESARFALDLACDRRHCQLAEAEQTLDERSTKALAWLDSLTLEVAK